MRILELSSNKESFHTVKFRETGISIIAAIKETDDQKKTYNSVGKSLTITLIHFCLASNSSAEFASKLTGWEFQLKFIVGLNTWIAKRSIDNPSEIFLNDRKLNLDDFKYELQKEVFRIPDRSKYLGFRSLISRFIRPSKYSYQSYDVYIKNEDKSPITPLMNNAFLLGLDIFLIIQKGELKERLDHLKELKNQLGNPEFKVLFSDSGEDIEIKEVDLESRIKKLRSNLSKFQIAEDYDRIRREVNEITYRLKAEKNRATKLHIAISNIDKSLELKPDISKDEIVKLYEEANLHFNELLVRNLTDLERFNSQIIENRTRNLITEKREFQRELQEVIISIKRLGAIEDSRLQYLNTHGALEEYTQLNKELADYEKRLDKLNQLKKLTSEYKLKQEQTKREFADQNIATNKYLEDIENAIKQNIVLFKSFADEFYSGKPAGISVDNNENVNSVRFDIKAKIEDDAGDAVNEVKIFCFDWTILKGRHNHSIDFLFHDSRITDGMDTRQVKTIFEIANKECKENDFQYILSLNENVIEGLKTEMTVQEHKNLIDDNIILRLSDKSESDKLLGIQIDLDYDS